MQPTPLTRSARRRTFAARALALAAAAALTGSAAADNVFSTPDPQGGFFGYIGFDVFLFQSVAARFTPSADYTLDSIAIWFMSNDGEGTVPQDVTITLRTDVNPGNEFVSIPSEVILETWTATLPVVGWNPELITFNSVALPPLAAGQHYWVVAESDLGPFINPIWLWSSSGNEFTATTDGPGAPWESGSGAAIAFRVAGTPAGNPCPADFNGQDGVSVQDIYDFLADWSSQISGGPVIIASADFNGEGGVTVQDIYDFLAAWNTGCPN